MLIVVVDDNRRVLSIICETLIDDGYDRTFGFADPFRARDFLKKQKADVLITDYDMPGLNGLQLVDLVPSIPKLFMISGFLPTDSVLKTECDKRGITAIMKSKSQGMLSDLLKKIKYTE